MKLATFETGDGERVGLVIGDRILDLSRALPDSPRDMNALIRNWPRWQPELEQLSRKAEPHFALADVHLLAPVPRPQKILAIGLNYDDHIAEAGRERPKTQTWFSKMPSAVNGPYDPVQLPKASSALDYEAELVFIIGKRCRHVHKEEAAFRRVRLLRRQRRVGARLAVCHHAIRTGQILRHACAVRALDRHTG